MTTVRARHLSDLVGQARSSSDPEVKKALVAVSTEVKERLTSASKESRDFFLSVSESIQELRGVAHAQLRAECLLECCQYFYVSGAPDLGLVPARHTLRLIEAFGRKADLRRANNMLGILCADTANLGQALEYYSAALQLAREIGDEDAELGTWVNVGTALIYMSRYQDALECLAQVRTRAPTGPYGNMLARKAAHNMSGCYFALGDINSAKACSEFAVTDDEPSTTAEFYSRVVREQLYVEALLETCDFKAARQRAEIASTYARRANTLRALEAARTIEGLIEVYCGSVARGLATLEALAASTREMPMVGRDVANALTRAYEKAGLPEKALACLQETLQTCRARRAEGALAHLVIAGGATSADFRTKVDLGDLYQRQANLQAKLAQRDLARSRLEVLERLAVTADLRDEESGAHGYRVGRLSAIFAAELGWSPDDCCALEQAARLHDIGKVGLPDRIVHSTAALQASERQLMTAHTSIGAELLARSDFDQLRLAENVARSHHEWWDGSGYPGGTRGTQIPLAARIVTLADVFDALTHGRPFEKPWTTDAAIAEIKRLRGRQFDPSLADRFVALLGTLSASCDDLDEVLSRGADGSSVLQARNRIRAMLDGAVRAQPSPKFDLATSKS